MSKCPAILLVPLGLLLLAVRVFGAHDLDAGVQDIVRQVTESLEERGKNKIAVTELTELDGSASNFDRYLSEKLITVIFRTHKFEIIAD